MLVHPNSVSHRNHRALLALICGVYGLCGAAKKLWRTIADGRKVALVQGEKSSLRFVRIYES